MSSPAAPAQRLIGDVLSAARAAKGVTLEDAARDTRIRVRKLRELEANDFTRFPHPSYVRLYLIDYAKYLGVPTVGILDLLPQQGASSSFGAHYLSIAHGHHRPRATPKKRGLPVATVVLASVALAVLVAAGFYGMKVAAALGSPLSRTSAALAAPKIHPSTAPAHESPPSPAKAASPVVGSEDDRALLSGHPPDSAR